MSGHETLAEKIFRAVYQLQKRGKLIFERKDVRDELGLSQEQMLASYSPIFQGMRVDQPGGAPNVGEKYKGIFIRIEHGRYRLTDKGKRLLHEVFD